MHVTEEDEEGQREEGHNIKQQNLYVFASRSQKGITQF